MKTLICLTIYFLIGQRMLTAQPVMTNSITRIDFNEDGFNEFFYSISADGSDESFPKTWDVGSGVHPLGNSKFLRASSNSVVFGARELIDSAAKVFQESLPGDVVVFGFGIMAYWAESYSPNLTNSWQYTLYTMHPVFEGKTEVLLGVRVMVDGGTHYGWLRFSRSVADEHTLFEIAGHDWNPVPDAPIGAGEPPPPPPLRAQAGEAGTVLFDWDNTHFGSVLEWSDSLVQPAWQPVPDGNTPPLRLTPEQTGQRFFRLRRL
jgi:hypothetical protein